MKLKAFPQHRLCTSMCGGKISPLIAVTVLRYYVIHSCMDFIIYHCLSEASRIVVVLISPSYIASKVCQEEYNLASAMHSDFAYSTKIIPLLVETTDGLPAWCMNHTPIDCRRMSDRDLKQFVKRIDVYNGRCFIKKFVFKLQPRGRQRETTL